MAGKSVDVIFCGNPGVGKSTLLSSISCVRFASGLNWGEGFTNKLTFRESPSLPNVRFGDTPGLADIKLAEIASAAITEALKDAAAKHRSVKIFFVCTVESGRVRPDDLFTIKQVMGSVTLADGSKPGMNSYGLIINKCTFLERPDFETKGKQILENAVGVPSQTVPFTTSYVTFLPNSDGAVDADNAAVFFTGLMEWVLAFPGLNIKDAAKIDVSDLEEKLKKAKADHKKEMDDLERRLREGHKDELNQMKAQMERSNRDLERRLLDAEAAAAAKGGGILGAIVDFSTIFSKPICRLVDGNSPNFEREFNKALGSIKNFCIV